MMQWLKQHLGQIVFILVGTIVLAFFLQYKLRDKYTESVGENTEQVLWNHAVSQEIKCDMNHVKSINVRFGTGGRINEGNMMVTLKDDADRQLQQWQLSLSGLPDNVYYEFALNNELEKGNYILEIEVQAVNEDNGIILYVKQNTEPAAMDYLLRYRTENIGIYILVVVLFVAGGIAACILSRFMRWEYIAVICFGILGSLYLCIMPATSIPDEGAHYLRTYEIASGGMLSSHDEDGSGVSYLPLGIVPPVLQDPFRGEYSGIYRLQNSMRSYVAYPDDIVKYRNPNQALYSPLSYIPQVIGVFVMKHFTNNTLTVFYAGRVTCLLVVILMLFFSVKWLPTGGRLMLVIAMLPMFMQETISYASDASINIFPIFMIAYLYKLRSEEHISWWKGLIFAAITVIIALCKVVYLPFALLVFCLPKEGFKSSKHAMVYKVGVFLLAVICNLAWLAISMSYLVEINPGVNSVEQIKFVLTHIPQFIQIVANTTFQNAGIWLEQLIGARLGWNNISLDTFLAYILMIILAIELIFRTEQEISGRDNGIIKYMSIVIVLSVLALTYASLYVQWTPLRNTEIIGIQGRYFIPLLLPLGLILKRVKVDIKHEKLLAVELGLMCMINIMSLVSVYQFYV